MKEFVVDPTNGKTTMLGFKSMISGSYFGETEILFGTLRYLVLYPI
jgi:hypothetical protein